MSDTFRKIIGDRLRKCRNRQGWTTTEAGKRIGVTQNRYSNWENAHRLPGPEELTRASKVFGVNVCWLSGYSNTLGDTAASDTYISANNPHIELANGESVTVEASDNIVFHAEYLKAKKLEQDRILLVRVLDNAMGKIASEGDEVLIDRNKTHVTHADLFAILVKNSIWIRWVKPELDGSYSVASENQDLYPAMSVQDASELNIIGRVCRICKDR